MSGIERFAKERARQKQVEEYSTEHDDEYENGELLGAAICYSTYALYQGGGRLSDPHLSDAIEAYWPWPEQFWKPADTPMRNLEKAGALLAAHVDLLERQA